MIGKVNIKNLLYVSGLVFLLLLSPCNVRNALQSAFSIPQTEVHNVSKAVVNSTNCNVNSVEKETSILSDLFFQSLKDFANKNTSTSQPKIVLHQQSNFLKSRDIWGTNDEVPFYILFKKMKLHI